MGDAFKALADPTRRRILELLAQGDLTAGEIAAQFDMTKPSVSHHLNILKAADLVSDERSGQNIVYSLNLTVFQELGNRAGINLIYVSTIFKVLGIAYLAEFSAQICRDAGSQAIAGKIELAGKVIILTLAIPILLAILEAIVALLPQGG